MRLWGVTTAYLMIGPIVAVIARGGGLVVAPYAEAVMGAVELAKAGIESAMNDMTQMLAAALSIAVIGSVMYAIYAANLGDAAASLPLEERDAVRDSIGAAIQTAALLPQTDGLALSTAAKTAFTDALGLAVLIGAGSTLFGALIVAKFMPARDPNVDEAAGHDTCVVGSIRGCSCQLVSQPAIEVGSAPVVLAGKGHPD